MSTLDPQPATQMRCKWCGASIDEDQPLCGLCGRARTGVVAAPPRPREERDFTPLEERRRLAAEDVRILGLPRGVAVWILGAVIAPVFTLTPLLQMMGWFLGAFVHEMGHAAMGWLMGCPAIPTVAFFGHAATPVFEQRASFAYAVWFLIAAGGVWLFRAGRRGAAAGCGVAALVYPLLAFTAVRGLLFVAGGHLGEFAFAALAFRRSLTGRDTAHLPERVAYAVVGFLLWGTNVALAYGLATSHDRRVEYQGNGSYGLTNDWIVVAEVYAGAPLSTVAWGVVWAALPLPAVVWFVSRNYLRRTPKTS